MDLCGNFITVCCFGLCKNYTVNLKIRVILVLCQIFDFSQAAMGKEREERHFLNLKDNY